MNFYPHFLGDYARDTKGLSVMEHGAYRLLMDHSYATEKMIPNDSAELYRIAGAMTPAERRAVDKVADMFFPVNGDGRRHHKRIEQEIKRAQEKSAKAKASAERRWVGNADDGANGMRSHGDGNANQNQNHGNSKASDASHRKPAAAPQGLDCPHDKLIALYHEVLPTCRAVAVWNAQRQALMRARWREMSEPKGKHPGYATEADGLAFWRRFFEFVKQSDFLMGKTDPGPNRKPFELDLEWLMRPTNFAKVVERKYHT